MEALACNTGKYKVAKTSAKQKDDKDGGKGKGHEKEQ